MDPGIVFSECDRWHFCKEPPLSNQLLSTNEKARFSRVDQWEVIWNYLNWSSSGGCGCETVATTRQSITQRPASKSGPGRPGTKLFHWFAHLFISPAAPAHQTSAKLILVVSGIQESYKTALDSIPLLISKLIYFTLCQCTDLRKVQTNHWICSRLISIGASPQERSEKAGEQRNADTA